MLCIVGVNHRTYVAVGYKSAKFWVHTGIGI